MLAAVHPFDSTRFSRVHEDDTGNNRELARLLGGCHDAIGEQRH
jgi:hypothetical protein